jgi:N-acetylglucosamine-6-phosphate deacetylase
MTIAAEQPNIAQAVKALIEKNITVSIGHSRPNDEQWEVASNAGASMVTHLFNGMSGVHHRDAGLALQALLDDTIFAGVIGDMIHVSPQALALAFRAKTSSRICLVSDSIGWNSAGAAKRGVSIFDGAPRLPDGTLAGSSTPLSECVRRVVQEAQIPLEDALRSATSTPAKAVGLHDVGIVAVGQPADLVAFDDSLHVMRTWSRLVSLRG